MKYSHKAQIQSRIFIYILVAVVILFLLIFAFISIRKARDRAAEIEQKKLEQEIDASLKEIEYGSVERKQLMVPPGTKEICFIDVTKRSEVLTSPILQADKYTRMRNIIQSGEKKNIFFLTQQEPYINTIYQSGICFDHYPYFVCLEPRANILNLYIEGKGSCSLIVMEYKICENIEPYLDANNKFTQEVSFGSIYAKMTIKQNTKIIDPSPPPNEICIESVSYIGVEGLISEVYNITPKLETDAEIEFNLKYEDFLLPPNTLENYIKLKKSSSAWQDITTERKPDIYRVLGKTNKVSYVAVFGPEAPTAVINVNGDVISEGTEAIIAKDTEVIFDGSASIDPDDDIAKYEWDFGDETPKSTDKTTPHTYTELGSYNVTLTVTDSLGNKDTATITVTVVNSDNQKIDNFDFIIIIENPSDWRDLLRLVPLAMWKDINGDHRNPYLIYHKEGTTITSNDFRMETVRSKYKNFKQGATIDRVLLFGTDSTLSGVANVEPKTIDADYFSYWKTSTTDVVIVDYNNQGSALMASLFAAFINSPIIFINKDNMGQYGDILTGKHAYIIDSLDADTDIFVKQKTTEQTYYTREHLKNPTRNQYQKLYSKIVLTS